MHCQTCCIFRTWKIPECLASQTKFCGTVVQGSLKPIKWSPGRTGSSGARVHDTFLSELMSDLHEESRDLFSLQGQKLNLFFNVVLRRNELSSLQDAFEDRQGYPSHSASILCILSQEFSMNGTVYPNLMYITEVCCCIMS
jgi:hypothetical protein